MQRPKEILEVCQRWRDWQERRRLAKDFGGGLEGVQDHPHEWNDHHEAAEP
jgi:hypothetical protein